MKLQRNTVQRQIVLQLVKKLHSHPTVEEVYMGIHKKHPTISKATVYRNLRQLAESGEIRQVSIPGDSDRFDNNAAVHYHFKCKTCGGITDINIEYLTSLNESVQQKYSFQVDEHDVIFRGICSKCGETCKNI